jgi:hypothetical protein
LESGQCLYKLECPEANVARPTQRSEMNNRRGREGKKGHSCIGAFLLKKNSIISDLRQKYIHMYIDYIV